MNKQEIRIDLTVFVPESVTFAEALCKVVDLIEANGWPCSGTIGQVPPAPAKARPRGRSRPQKGIARLS